MRVVLLVALCLFSTTARADFSANDFLAKYDAAKSEVEKFIWSRHISDTQNGFSWANSFLDTTRHEPPLLRAHEDCFYQRPASPHLETVYRK